MIDQELLVRSVTEAATEVFSMMLDMEIQYTGLTTDSVPADMGLIALVGITGDWGGSGVFCCPPSLASLICSRMLGSEPDPSNAINDEVLDVVAEMTNMMIGNIKNGLEAATGPLAISVPTVIHGRNFHFRNASGLQGAALSFTAEGENFEVRIALAPVAQQPSARSRIPILGLAHV